MSSWKRRVIMMVLLVATLETLRPGTHGLWLVRLAILYQAETWCQHGCADTLPLERFPRAGFLIHTAQGNLQQAERLTTHRAEGNLVWRFWRGNEMVAEWSLRAPDGESVGSWYADERLRLIKVCLKGISNVSPPVYVREDGVVQLRYIVLVQPDGKVVGCLVAMWET